MTGGIARRYVRPLFEIAAAQGQLDRVQNDLQSIDAALAQNPDLRRFLLNPSVDRSARRRVADEVFAEACDAVRGFIRVVLDKNRAGVLFVAAKLFGELLNRHRGITPGVVETAVPLDDAAFRDLTSQLEQRFGGKLELERRVNPSLLGGVRVRVGNTLLDGSVQRRLEQLRAAIAGE